MVGGVGTRVIQAEQEDLMAEAWNQVGDVEAAHPRPPAGAARQQLGASLHQRHLATMSEAGLLAATERVHAKVLSGPGQSVWAAVGASSLPPAVATGAFRRLTRLRGPVVKAAKLDAQPLAVEALTVREDHLTADWVLSYANPDAVAALGPAARERIDARVAGRIAPGVDRDALLAEWDDALKAPGPEEALSSERVAQGRFDTLDVRVPMYAALLVQLLAGMPPPEQMREDEDAAAAGAATAEHLSALRRNSSTSARSRCRWRTRGDSILVADEDRQRRLAIVEIEPLRDWANRMLDLIRQMNDRLPFPEFERAAEGLKDRLIKRGRISGDRLASGFKAIAERIVTDDQYAEDDRSRLDVPALGLLGKLDPKITVPARINARLTLGSGRLPSWIRRTGSTTCGSSR